MLALPNPRLTMTCFRLVAGVQPTDLPAPTPFFDKQLELNRKVWDRVWRDERGLA